MSELTWDNITSLAEELGLEISDANDEMSPGIYTHIKGDCPQRLSVEDMIQICLGDIRVEDDYGNYEYAGEQH
jgi:hypothetical protein